jgi:ATP-dependent DNA helicase DinG
MRCVGCGFNLTVDDAPKGHQCNACGGRLLFDSDDFLLRQHGAPGRDVRPGQVEMGRLVEKVIREHAVAFIEAPVGSGKSDAYGVPAIITAAKDSAYSLKNFKGSLPSKLAEQKTIKPRIVISTAKKNLQHQIAEKDLPFIRKRHGEESIAVALLKGKSNYACRLKADTSLEPRDKAQFTAWIDSSPGEDLSDFPGKRPPYLFDVTAEDCVGKSCEYAYDQPGVGPKCGFWRAKQAAAKASIIVTNHHVVAYDLRFGPGAIIGAYTTLILDEAHQAPASFRAAFSNVLSQGATTRMIRQIDAAGVGGGLDHALRDAWQGMFTQLDSVEGEIPKDPFGAAGLETGKILAELSVETAKEADNLGWSSLPGWDITKITDKADRTRLMSVLSLKKNLERTSQTLNLSRDPGDNTVLYVATSEKGLKRLTLAPISVGKLVGPKLQMIPSVVITSATMAINGKFDDAKYQLGLNWASYNDEEGAPKAPKVIHELILNTPFNYDKQALLYTPRHIPLPVGATSPDRRGYVAALINECDRLIRASNGNAFILFTAKQDLLDVHAGLLENDLPQPLIVQEDDAAATLKVFMATPNSVLLGVKSFWEGVDVQGQKLQLVVITKLPFPALTDPVLQARSRQLVAEQVKQGVSPQTAKSAVFNRLQIPHMLTELRQGAGRLIRARTDKGVLAILDSRMFTGNSTDKPAPTQTTFRGYGKLAADSTGFNNHVFDFEVIQRVLAQWNQRHATTTKSSSTPGVSTQATGVPSGNAR